MNKPKKPTFIVTSGPTREFIDPIRYLSNPSTGKMGYFIAQAVIKSADPLIFISGPVDKKYGNIVGAKKNISVVSTEEMLNAVLKNLKNNSVLIMAAAPADYKSNKRFKSKIKKIQEPSIQLIPNPDILKKVQEKIRQSKLKNIFCIGFAAETDDAYKNAHKKLKEKNLDMIFLNNVRQKNVGFASDTNQITMIKKNNSQIRWKLDTKENLAYKIIDEVKICLEL